MGLWTIFAVLFTTVYALARATRGDRDARNAWIAISLMAIMLGTIAIDAWEDFIHQYKLIAGPLIAKHGMSIPTTAPIPVEISAWILGAPIAGLVLALVSPWLATAAENALAAVAS